MWGVARDETIGEFERLCPGGVLKTWGPRCKMLVLANLRQLPTL